MKKLIAFLLVIPSFAFAQVPTGIMGFMDGKLYNTSTNSLAYICFLDGNCYNKEMEFAFNRGIVAGAKTETPVYTLLTITGGYPRALDDSQLSSEFTSVSCHNVTENSLITLRCVNDSNNNIQVKQVLFSDILVKYNPDYQSVTDQFSPVSNGSLSNFKSDSTNTVFYRTPDPTAKVVVDVNVIVSPKSEKPAEEILKVYNLYPSLVLVNIKGKDVVYKVN